MQTLQKASNSLGKDMPENIQLGSSMPEEFPLHWASDWGEDKTYGLWMAFTYKGIRQCFRWIKPGKFMMGSPEDEPEREDNEQQHEVVVTEGFWLAETACIQELWGAVMGENPSGFKSKNRPVERVSWNDCNVFLHKINGIMEGLDLCLPTEAQWEYACRAGTTTPFSFGEEITTEQANYNGRFPYNSELEGKNRGQTVEVKSLPCNHWGLYEMHGNVYEWCQDWFDDYSGSIVDPTGPTVGSEYVLRGGCCSSGASYIRSAHRSYSVPNNRGNLTGFRLARGR